MVRALRRGRHPAWSYGRPSSRHDHRRPARHRDGLSRVAHTVRAASAGRRRETGSRRLARRVGHQDALLRLDPCPGRWPGWAGRCSCSWERTGTSRARPRGRGSSASPRSCSGTGSRPGCSAVRASSATRTGIPPQHRRQPDGQSVVPRRGHRGRCRSWRGPVIQRHAGAAVVAGVVAVPGVRGVRRRRRDQQPSSST